MLVFAIAGLLTSQVGLCAPDASTDEQLSVTWIYPKGGEVFHYLDTVNVSYQSSYPEPWLYTFCYENETANTVRQSTPTTQRAHPDLEPCQLTAPEQSACKKPSPMMPRC